MEKFKLKSNLTVNEFLTTLDRGVLYRVKSQDEDHIPKCEFLTISGKVFHTGIF